MPVETMLNQMLIIIIMAIVGIIMVLAKVLTKDMADQLGKVLLNVSLPCSIIASADIKELGNVGGSMVTVIAAATGYYIFAIIVSSLVFKRIKVDPKESGVLVASAVFANTGFLGIPICAALFGNIGVLYAACVNLMYNIFMWTYGVRLFSKGTKFNIKNIMTNPATIASFAMIIIMALKISLPKVLLESLTLIGNINLPLSMLIIAYSIMQINFTSIFSDKYIYIVSFLRLIVFPVSLLFVMLLLRIEPTITMVSVVIAACPVGATNVVLSSQYGFGLDLTSKAVVQSMLFFMITMPLILMVMNFFLA